MRRSFTTGIAAALICASAAAPRPAAAQLFLTDPGFQKGPIEGSDPIVGLPIPGATPAEYRAHLLWNLRAGLNVAALQCQFSKYLRAVDNYNGILAHHSKELAEAYTTMNNYFKRVQGSAAKGQKAFDDYTTSTYNNFSTLQAQFGFCQTASAIAKEALTRPKGQFHLTAQQRMRELRSSLVPAQDRVATYSPHLIAMPVLPPLDDSCYDRRNELKKKCAVG
ncbi:MAG TPA: hypothetical protein VGW34_10285 [Allosphingosinicella sp.]|nr:hypothetical protein [Allosphingosinicella sp.]